jgi:hypothetical protein
MPFAVIISNNEGGCPATVHATLDDVKAYLRAYMQSGNPPLDDEERAAFEADLLRLTGECVETVAGSEAWKEIAYVAPVAADQITTTK